MPPITMPPVTKGLALALAITFTALAIGSSVRLLSLRSAKGKAIGPAQERRKSLVVWWKLTILFSCALVTGRGGLAILFCLASLLALREFHGIFRRRSLDTPALSVALGLMTVCHYLILGFTISKWSMWAFPFLALMTITATEVLTGRTADYLRTTAGYYWASILLVFGLSHVIATTELPVSASSWNTGTVGWCLFLVILTEVNDIAQAIVGRVYGKHRLTPMFSPGKSWEGFMGGITVTSLLALLLAPWLTSFHDGRAIGFANLLAVSAGMIIATCGLLGDLNISGLKREAGVKDSSSLLPGMGGILDRIDSLTIAAPAFYYFAALVTGMSIS